MTKGRLSLLTVAVLCCPIGVASARADDIEDFYRGKTIQVLNAFEQGGRYGVLARLVATHLPRHLPGKPSGVPQFMPGAGRLLQANHLYNVSAKDGTVIGLALRQHAHRPSAEASQHTI